MSNKIQCVYHGSFLREDSFYLSMPSSLYRGIGRIPVCKSCMEKILDELYAEYKDERLAVFHLCRKLDIPFDSNFYNGATKGSENPWQTFSYYMRQINSFGRKQTTGGFDSGEDIRITQKQKEQKHVTEAQNFLTEDDKTNKYQVIKILGSDPFVGMSEEDQKRLYNDLINYLHDENVVEDQFLLSQIVQVVINNNQIREIDKTLSDLMRNSTDIKANSGKINALNSMKKDLVSNNNKIAKDNGLNSGKMGGKSTLTETIQKLTALDFEEAEISFYDQKLNRGMQRASDISHKSVMEFLQIDDADVRDMLLDQRQLLQSYQNENLVKDEKIRILGNMVREYEHEYGVINSNLAEELKALKSAGGQDE